MTEPETTCKGFEVNHLVKQYANADKPVLDDISFKVEHGSVLVVLGPSGSGKSTLLRTIAGLEPIQGGTISINNQVIDAGKPGTERAGRSDRSSELRTRIGMVFQSYDLFPNKTVLGNITMAPVLVQKRDKSEVEAEAIRLLGRVGLADRKDSWPHELSGGQRQALTLLMATLTNPRVLLRFEAKVNEDAPTDKTVDNKAALTVNNGVTPSNKVENEPPVIKPSKQDTQKDPTINIDGKTALLGETSTEVHHIVDYHLIDRETE